MDVGTSSLLWELLFSSIGLGYFIYGRKQRHMLALATGVGLMIYPYFMPNLVALVVVGLILMIVPLVLKR